MEKNLQRKLLGLTEVNQEQGALAHFKTQFDGSKSDIDSICEKLLLFAGIWISVGASV